MKAFVLFLLSLKYVHEHRFFPYLLLNLIGMSFHTSSIIYIMLYPLWNSRFLIKWMIPIFVIGNILFLFQIRYLDVLLSVRGDWMQGIQRYFLYFTDAKSYNFSIGYVERITTYLLIYKNAELLLKSEKNIVYINAYILYFIFFFYFTEISVIVDRLPSLVVFSYWILYPYLVNSLCYKKSFCCRIFYLGILCFCFFKVTLTYQGFISKYENILFASPSALQREAWYQSMGRW